MDRKAVRQPIIPSPDSFAGWFNMKVPGAYRCITAQDIRDMVECGLIGHYHYFGQTDLETVRAILQYEKLRDERIRKEDTAKICKRCGESLSQNRIGRGRPKEYCNKCEKFRNRERYDNWKAKLRSK